MKRITNVIIAAIIAIVILYALMLSLKESIDDSFGKEVENRISDHNSYRVLLKDDTKKATIFSWNVLSYGCRSGFLDGKRPTTTEEKESEDTRMSKRSDHIKKIVNTCSDAIFVFQEVDEEFEKDIDEFKNSGYDVLTKRTLKESFSLSILWNKNIWESKGMVYSRFIDKIKSSGSNGEIILDSQKGRYLGLYFKHKESNTDLIVCNVHIKWRPINISEAMRSNQEWKLVIDENEPVDNKIPWVILGDMNIDISRDIEDKDSSVTRVVSQNGCLVGNSMNTSDGAFSNIKDVTLEQNFASSYKLKRPSNVNTDSMKKIVFNYMGTTYKDGRFIMILNNRRGVGKILDQVRTRIPGLPNNATDARLYCYIKNDKYRYETHIDVLERDLKNINELDTSVEIYNAKVLGNRIYVRIIVDGDPSEKLRDFVTLDVFVFHLKDLSTERMEYIKEEFYNELTAVYPS